MKKAIILILVLIFIMIISFLSAYNTLKSEKDSIQKFNSEYETYYNKEIYGTELATIINKVINNNVIYNIQKDSENNYIDDNVNSIKMDIYIIDADTVYQVERIYSLKTERFIENFNSAKFKCTKIEYHAQSNKVKYLYFEQISN